MEKKAKSRPPEKHSAGVGDQDRSASPQVFIHFPMQETRVAENASNVVGCPQTSNRQVRKKDVKYLGK